MKTKPTELQRFYGAAIELEAKLDQRLTEFGMYADDPSKRDDTNSSFPFGKTAVAAGGIGVAGAAGLAIKGRGMRAGGGMMAGVRGYGSDIAARGRQFGNVSAGVPNLYSGLREGGAGRFEAAGAMASGYSKKIGSSVAGGARQVGSDIASGAGALRQSGTDALAMLKDRVMKAGGAAKKKIFRA